MTGVVGIEARRLLVPLNEGQKQKLRDWMKSKGVRPTCASCGEKDWGAGEIISATVLSAEGIQISEAHVPMVQIVCTNCSYVMSYAAVPMGLP